MAGFRRNSDSSSERRFGNDRPRRRDDAPQRFGDRGDRGSRPPEMFPAVCDSCGANCEVPFRPSGSKPVLCRSCFRKDGSSSDSPRQSSQPAPTVDLSEINEKLDKIIAFLKIN